MAGVCSSCHLDLDEAFRVETERLKLEKELAALKAELEQHKQAMLDRIRDKILPYAAEAIEMVKLKAENEKLKAALRLFLPPEGNPPEDWWCPECHEWVSGHHVTSQEAHEDCGTILTECQPKSKNVERAQAALKKGDEDAP